jgi:hypothetical protein
MDLKRGDTFQVIGVYADANELPIDITNVQIRSQVRDKYLKLLADCVIVKTDAINCISSLTVLDTTAWPIGEVLTDVQYTLPDGRVSSTATIKINVVVDVTI